MFCLGALFGDYDHDRPSRTRDKPIPGRLVADIRVGEQSGKACRDLRCGNWAAWRGKKMCLPDRPFSPYRPNTHWRTRVSIENFCQVTVRLKARNIGCSDWGCDRARPSRTRYEPIPGRLVADIRVGEQSGKAWRDLRCGNRVDWGIRKRIGCFVQRQQAGLHQLLRLPTHLLGLFNPFLDQRNAIVTVGLSQAVVELANGLVITTVENKILGSG